MEYRRWSHTLDFGWIIALKAETWKFCFHVYLFTELLGTPAFLLGHLVIFINAKNILIFFVINSRITFFISIASFFSTNFWSLSVSCFR